MTSKERISPVDVARRFHEIYERLAPQFGYETRRETRQFDPNSPNGSLMIAVCSELQQQGLMFPYCSHAVSDHP